MTSFISLDVETANSSRGSICQIGSCIFDENGNMSTWDSLIDPCAQFSEMNKRIHKITEEHVIGCPKFHEVYPTLKELIGGRIVITYTAFDKQSLLNAFEANQLPPLQFMWLDASIAVRNVWPEKFSESYKLKNVAKEFGMTYQHHNALEDARVCGQIFLKAVAESKTPISEWYKKHGEFIASENKTPSGIFANQTFALDGYTIPFSISQFIMANGGTIKNAITYSTTMIIVDFMDQDTPKLEKTRRYNSKGGTIRVVTPDEFIAEFMLVK